MAKRPPSRMDAETPTGSSMAAGTPDQVFGRAHDSAQMFQIVMDTYQSVAVLGEKLSSIEKKIDSHSADLKDVRESISFVKGVIWCAIPLLALFGVVFWWAMGERISDALKVSKPPVSAAAPAPPATK